MRIATKGKLEFVFPFIFAYLCMIMRKRMKFLKIGAVTVAMTALTQCASVQEVEVVHPVGGTFEVYASPAADGAGTRTSNDGLHTLWVQGDRFSLFHAAAGSTAYTSDGAFTVDNPSTGHAKGTVTGHILPVRLSPSPAGRRPSPRTRRRC